MTFVTFTDDRAREWLIEKEDSDVRKSGEERSNVRASLARNIGVSPGTIENIRRGRFKSLRTSVRDAIQGFFIRSLQDEIMRLEHVLDMALQCGQSPASDEVIAAKAALANARTLLSAGAKSNG